MSIHLSAAEGQPRNGGDRGERLAPKAERADAFELGERGDLAGRMAAQRERQFARRDAVAVVFDDDRADAAAHQLHADFARAGIERVVDQLAHHRSRALDDFAGGDLADQLVRQFADRAARRRLEHCVHASIVGSAGAGAVAAMPR